MPKRIRLNVSKSSAITIGRIAIKADKLVYVAKANKKIRYKYGRSRILYFGTTKAGARRIAQSAASRAEQFLTDYGIKSLEFHIVTANAVPGLKSWRLVERALILRFHELFGEPPKGNVVGKRMRWNDELKYLTHGKLDNVIHELS
jgi:predicted GIY-YIG superfamily endonuclease